jgi:hypothetical protein
MARLGALFFLVIGLLAAFTPAGWIASGSHPLAARVIWGIGGLSLAVWLELRMARQGIYVAGSGLLIRGGMRSEFLPWDEIGTLRLRQSAWGLCAVIDTTDGRTVPAYALNAGRGILPSMVKRAQAQVDELNGLVSRNRR